MSRHLAMTAHLAHSRTFVCKDWSARNTCARLESAMSIKERGKRASTDSQNGEYPERRVVPETTIRDFGGLGMAEVDRFTPYAHQHLQLGLVNRPEVTRTFTLEDIRGLGRPS